VPVVHPENTRCFTCGTHVITHDVFCVIENHFRPYCRMTPRCPCCPTLPEQVSDIEAKQTSRGGWTRAQLAEWGVPWPPPRGWRKKLERELLKARHHGR